jgi:hypothetical protein
MQFRTTTRRGIGLAGLFCVCSFLCLDRAVQGKPGQAPAKPSPPSVCKVDRDCVLVVDGCCSCTEGGKQRAVPVAARSSYESRRKAMCRQTMCPALMSEDPSCLASRAVCKDGACALGSD